MFTRRSFIAAAGVSISLVAVGVDALGRPTAANASGTYLRPCGNVAISDSWYGHKSRTPPSAEPGTDYGVPRGTPVLAATSGYVVDRKDTTSTATGRYVAIQADDGNYLRYLHLNQIIVPVSQRVNRGDIIAYSGASGFGSDTGYGAHVHVSLWVGGTPFQLGFANSVDFENYVGNSSTPSNQAFEIIRRNNNMASLYYKTEGGTMFALAGDGIGSAAWLETTQASFANQLALQHGNAALLSLDTWNSWKARYLGQA